MDRKSDSIQNRQKVRIVHLISGLDIGGSEMALYHLLSKMDGDRFENEVNCLIPIGPVGDMIRELGVSVGHLNMQRGRPSLSGLLRLKRILQAKRYSLLQTWLYHADLLGLLAARLAGLRTVVWNIRCSDMDMSRYSSLSGWTVKACARFSAYPQAVVVNSEAGRAYHKRIGYHPRQWAVIPNGIDTQRFCPQPDSRRQVGEELSLAPEAFLIGLVARYDPMKDHATFLRAAGSLIRTNPEVQFILAGESVTRENLALGALIEQERLAGHIRLLGLRSDIPKLMAALDIATCCSRTEGFPNVVAEAMACGVPCVATDVGDTARIAGDTGVLVPSANPAALAEGWRRIIHAGPAARERLGLAARLRIKSEYDIERMADRYENLYLSLMEEQEAN